jgi:hypothetical protein
LQGTPSILRKRKHRMPKTMDERVAGLEAKLKRLGLQAVAMRCREWSLIARFLVVGSLLYPMAAPHAIARIGKCSMGSLNPAGERLLLEAARRVLPPQSEPSVSNLCGSTSAEITTQKIPDQPGLSHWWVAACRRESREWVCDPVRFQEMERPLRIGGEERQVAITILENNTVIESALSLATKALNLYADPRSQLPHCGIANEPARWRTLREQLPLPRGTIGVHVTAQQYAKTGFVLLDEIIQPDDIQIRIDLAILESDRPGSGYPCWMAMAP